MNNKTLLKVALCDDDLVVETQVRAFLGKDEAERGGDLKILLSVKKSGEELLLTDAPLNPGQQLTVEQSCSRLVVSTV